MKTLYLTASNDIRRLSPAELARLKFVLSKSDLIAARGVSPSGLDNFSYITLLTYIHVKTSKNLAKLLRPDHDLHLYLCSGKT